MIGALFCLLLGAPLAVEAFPRPAPEARAFIAPAEKQERASLWFLDRGGLTVYPGLRAEAPLRLPLDSNVSAVDVFDVDGDASMDVVFVSGDTVGRFEIIEGAVRGPETLLRQHSRLSDPTTTPFLHTLATPVEDSVCIALPTDRGVTLYDLDGSVRATYEAGAERGSQVVFGRPFTQWSSMVSELGGPGTLEFRVSRVEAFKPRLPADGLPWPVATPVSSPVGRGSTRNPDRPPEDWPYFLLGTDAGAGRAAYLTVGPEHFETLVRIARPSPDAGEGVVIDYGPPRRYPGRVVIPPESTPDFNNDGFTDLLLWQTNRPGLTVDALTRAATGERWPLFLGVHLFVPEKARFDPRPAGRIRLEVPVAWFLAIGAAAPLQHVVLEDLDGDGDTDLCLSGSPTIYRCWCYEEGDFPDAADLTIPLETPLHGVAFRTPSPRGNGVLVGLETEEQVYVIRANP